MNIEKMLINNSRKAMLDNINVLDKKTLQRKLESHLKLEFKYKDKIDRLNNIINEIEVYCNMGITMNFNMNNSKLQEQIVEDYTNVLDKLKELKEEK